MTRFKGLLCVAVLALAAAPVAAVAHTADDPYISQLLAGQDIPVGEVQVWNDDTNLYVKYVIDDPDWCLTETHLQVATSLEGIPQKNGNPIPGKFDLKGEHECVMDVLYEIPLDASWACGDDLYVAAHSVVLNQGFCQAEAIVYGVERGSGDIYQVDVVAGTATLVADITDPAPNNMNSPNGLAYDAVNGRLYFSAYDDENATDSELYFWDGSQMVSAGTVPGLVAGATFHGGFYWYVKNATDDMVKVAFNADGTVDTAYDAAPDFTGNTECFRFGDLVVDERTITVYGSSLQCLSTTPPTFFSLDGSFGYTMISTVNGTGLQLAFGSDGTLYGQSTGSGEFFTIDPATGATVSAGTPTGASDGFTDLASGERCIPPDETAWGDGEDFPGKNWATYFTYAIQCEIEWPEGGTMSVAFEDLPLTSGNDWDYNDFVADIETVANFATPTSINGISFTIRPEAKIAGYWHTMHMATDFGCVGSWELLRDGSLVASGDYSGSQNLIVLPDSRNFPASDISLTVSFDDACNFSFPDWDPSLVHGENLFFDPYIHINGNTGNTVNVGDVRMLTVPVDWVWPTPDGTRIWNVYPCVTAGNPPTFVPYWWNPGCTP